MHEVALTVIVPDNGDYEMRNTSNDAWLTDNQQKRVEGEGSKLDRRLRDCTSYMLTSVWYLDMSTWVRMRWRRR